MIFDDRQLCNNLAMINILIMVPVVSIPCSVPIPNHSRTKTCFPRRSPSTRWKSRWSWWRRALWRLWWWRCHWSNTTAQSWWKMYEDQDVDYNDEEDLQARDLCRRLFIRSGAAVRILGFYQHPSSSSSSSPSPSPSPGEVHHHQYHPYKHCPSP